VPLHIAAANNQRGAAEALLEHGAEVDASDSDGQTPLMEAARSGSIEVLQLLLDRHANVDYQDKEGRSALVWAATKGDWPKVVASLVKAGAQVGLKDRTGNTALSRANLLGHHKTAEILSQSTAA
jgi:ankyrin repeat protein